MSASLSLRLPREGGGPASERSSLVPAYPLALTKAASRRDQTPALILSLSKDAGDAGLCYWTAR